MSCLCESKLVSYHHLRLQSAQEGVSISGPSRGLGFGGGVRTLLLCSAN